MEVSCKSDGDALSLSNPDEKKQQNDYSFGEVIKNLVWVSKIGG